MFVVIPLSIYYIKSQRIKKLKINQEVFDLYNDEKYTLALEKALSITEKVLILPTNRSFIF